MTGPLTTSSHQERENLTMTSTTCNQCAEPVMEGSETGCCSVSLGATQDTNSPQVKTGRGKYWGDPAPRLLKKRRRAKHRATYIPYGWRAQLLWIRLSWRTHWHPSIKASIDGVLSKKSK